MARPLRIEYDGALYHVTSRGNARKSIFRDDDDRTAFLDVLAKVNKRFNWICHAYCLMDNHYHLVIETPDGNLSRGMRQLNGVYTQLYNRRHKRVGHIFQGRYKAIVVQKESYLLELCRYVVLNPARAGAVKSPREWKWSSYGATAGLHASHSCLSIDWILGQFGKVRKQAELKYREFVLAGMDQRGIWEKVQGQSILGKGDFTAGLIGYIKGYEDIKEIPRRQRYVGRPSLAELFGQKKLVNKSAAMRKAVMDHGYTLKEVADYLNIHYSTVSRIIGKEVNARNKT